MANVRHSLRRGSRIGIVNRGEAAVRFIRSVREFNSLFGTEMKTIAFHLDEEGESLFVDRADVGVPLSRFTREPQGNALYRDRDSVLRALLGSDCDAVWPGWGFLSEDSSFAEMLEAEGLTFIGPNSASIKLLGDKIRAKRLAETARIPIVPWSNGGVASAAEAVEAAESIGYPLAVKSANAGGGRGIRFVYGPEEVESKFLAAIEETERVTGDRIVFMEKMISDARHLEVQVIADRMGNVHAYGVRDCSVQRKNQKVLEETPPPGLPARVLRSMERAAVRLIRASEYENAGTVEFLLDRQTGKFYFMEVNTRLQVEHPITEALFDIDLVVEQLRVASGMPLGRKAPYRGGAAMEVRLNAEDPSNRFLAAPGRVLLLNPPCGAGIRFDSGIREGDSVSSHFDSMIAKVIAYGRDRGRVISRLKRALSETEIKVQGGTTNRSFLISLLDSPGIAEGGVPTTFVESFLEASTEDGGGFPHIDLALESAGILVAREHINALRIDFRDESLRSGRPRNLRPPGWIDTTVSHRGISYTLRCRQTGFDRYQVASGRRIDDLGFRPLGEKYRMDVGGVHHDLIITKRNGGLTVEVDGEPYVLATETNGVVRSPSPGTVMDLRVSPGDEVAMGAPIAVLEAMKMEMVIPAPISGVVREIRAARGEQLGSGEVLLILGKTEAQPPEVKRFLFEEREDMQHPDHDWCIALGELNSLFLGFSAAVDYEDLTSRLTSLVEADRGPRESLLVAIADCIDQFIRVEALFSGLKIEEPRFVRKVSFGELMVHLFRRSLSANGGLPESFRQAMDAAVDLYGRRGRTSGASRDEALFHIHASHAFRETKQQMLRELLLILVRHSLPIDFHERYETLLNELHSLSLRLPSHLAVLALYARQTLIDKPRLDESRRRPVPLGSIVSMYPTGMGYLASRYFAGNRRLREDLLRHVGMAVCRGSFFDVEASIRESGDIVFWENRTPAGRTVVAFSALDRLESTVRALGNGEVPEEGDHCELILTDTEVQEPGDLISSFRWPFASVAILSPLSSKRHRGFRKGANGSFVEEPLSRAIPMRTAAELGLDRYEGFDLELMEEHDRTWMVLARAKSNPADERILVLVDVNVEEKDCRFEPDGRVVSIPAWEYAFFFATNILRGAIASHTRPLTSNRLVFACRIGFQVTRRAVREYAQGMLFKARDLDLECLEVRVIDPFFRAKPYELLFDEIGKDKCRLRVVRPLVKRIAEFDSYRTKVRKAGQRGVPDPFAVVRMLCREGEPFNRPGLSGEFIEHEVSNGAAHARVHTAAGWRDGNLVFGTIVNRTSRHPAGMKRILIVSDASRDMGSLSESECVRINAAIDLADDQNIPVEWIAVSSGARIDLDSGTENLDWTARTLKRLVEFTRSGGQVNVIVPAVNVGAQSYWNAEATMLMHTRGILIMTEDASMMLTGKRALDYAGGVSGEDDKEIGGVDHVMGPNGQAQMIASTLREAYEILFSHYGYTYPGGEGLTDDPADRDICVSPYEDHLDQGFTRIGDIFDNRKNGDRKKPFEMRQLMKQLVDRDGGHLERWHGLKDGEIGIVWETRLGGIPLGLIGVESRSVPRLGDVPYDGPESWNGGTLFPQSSRKLARAINAFSGVVPLVILLNLSGFDGSPESLRNRQLEYGAEIGKAIVEFDGQITVAVVGRYHGGAYVVFSKALNENLRVVALEGSYASVIGGAPAAAVIFHKRIINETLADPRLKEVRWAEFEHDRIFSQVLAEKQANFAKRFDETHNIHRALRVGSIDEIISPSRLRPYLISRLRQRQ